MTDRIIQMPPDIDSMTDIEWSRWMDAQFPERIVRRARLIADGADPESARDIQEAEEWCALFDALFREGR